MDKLAAGLLAGSALALGGAWWLPNAAEAQEDESSPPGRESVQKRVAVLRFTGTQAARARSAVVAGLKRHAILVDGEEFEGALETVDGPTHPDRIAAACRALGVDAVIEGSMHRVSRAWSVEIWVRDCANGEKVSPGGRATFTMRNLGGAGSIAATLWSRVGAVIVATGSGAATTSVAARSPPSSSGAGAASRAPPASGGSGPRVAARAPPSSGQTSATRRAPVSPPASRQASSYLTECLFEEDEPPEGFPTHADWVRRRNAFMASCERERVRRAAAERRAREEAARARADGERRAREEAERARAETERRAREETALARAEAERRARENSRRRADAERRAREEEAASVRVAEAERRRAVDEERRRHEDEELEAQVGAYRERLRRESEGSYTSGTTDPGSQPDAAAPSYEGYEASYEGGDRPPIEPPEEARPRRWRGRGDRRPDDEHAASERRPEPAASTRATREGPVVFNLGAGLSFMNRTMSVEVEGTGEPRTYYAPGFPELTVAGELFPAAIAGTRGAASGLGIFGTFRRAIYVATSGPSGPDSPGGVIDVPTAEQELLGGGLFRMPMGTARRSPIFSLSVGYGYFVFQLDEDAMSQLDPNKQMPTMYYQNVVGNAGVSVPLAAGGLAVDLEGSYRYVLDVGQAARDLFGSDTKGGYGFGLRAGLSGEAPFIARGLVWSFSGEYLVLNTEFSGPSSCLDGALNCFPSGSDRYIRGMFLAGYRYR